MGNSLIVIDREGGMIPAKPPPAGAGEGEAGSGPSQRKRDMKRFIRGINGRPGKEK
jgi:hypothetical protein